MTKRFMQLVAAVLVMALSVPAAGAVRADGNGQTMIRVGLASSDSHNTVGEQEAAHLQNNTGYGAGFRFGYYDSKLNFVELGRTGKSTTEVAVIKTQNLCYGYVASLGKYTYSSSITSDIVVGCYHVRIPGFYATYEDAARDAEIYGGFVAWINGEYQVRIGAFQSKEGAQGAVAELGQGEVVGTSSYGLNVVATGTNRILFQFDGGAGTALAVAPDVTDAGDVRTWYAGFKYRGGFQYQRVTGGNITVVNVVELEDYIKGVVCYEMGRSWPLEALKTQAVCARTYALRNLNHHSNLGFDLCNTASCQVYYGVGSNRADYGPSDTSDRAVEETAGKVLAYRGELAATYYSSSHGGASEEIANVWSNNKAGDYPYLCGVIDPYEETIADLNPKSHWTVSYTAKELTQRLNNKGYGVGSSIDDLELTYSSLGNVIKVTVHWKNGQKNIFKPGGNNSNGIRGVFGVDSIHFTVNGQTANKNSQSGSSSSGNGSYAVNGSGALSDLDGLYVITGKGTVTKADEDLYVITGDGDISELEEKAQTGSGTNEGGGTVTVSGSSYVFEGGGWGHQIGMSQYGANAMARLGFTYDEICTFYYPGTEIRSCKEF